MIPCLKCSQPMKGITEYSVRSYCDDTEECRKEHEVFLMWEEVGEMIGDSLEQLINGDDDGES